MSYLIVDKRERALDKQVNDFSERYFVIKHQFNFGGDYIIMDDNNVIIAAIERKTFKDLAASIRSGRIDEQINKMVLLRKQTKCDLYIILEGNSAFPSDDHYFGRMPYKNLKGKLINIQIRYNINVIRTKNINHTMSTIEDYFVAYRNIKKVGGVPLPDNLIPKELMQNLPTKYESIVISGWKQLLPIGLRLETIKYILTKTNLVNLMNGNVNFKLIDNITELEVDKFKSIIALTKTDKFINLLTVIKGISKKYAESIMKYVSPIHLVNLSLEDIISLEINNKRLGPAKGQKIFELVNYKLTEQFNEQVNEQVNEQITE